MRSISLSPLRAKRPFLLLVMALFALGACALCVADSLRAAARCKAELPSTRAVASGSLAPGLQSINTQSPGQHGPRTVHFDLLAKLLADDRRGNPEAWRRELADPEATCRVETQPHPLLGQAAPDFTLCDHLGAAWNLREQLAQGPVVIVFYLGYSCNACVHHLCELSADIDRFRDLGAQVVAISADPPELTRQRFDAYGALGITILSDPDHAVARQFGTLRPAAASQAGGESGPAQVLHGTFIVDRQGDVRWVNCGEVPFRSDMALLYQLAQLDVRPPQPQPVEARQP